MCTDNTHKSDMLFSRFITYTKLYFFRLVYLEDYYAQILAAGGDKFLPIECQISAH